MNARLWTVLLIAGANLHAAPTFSKDIAPILFSRCAGCHRPGEVAPFPLLTYQDVGKRATLIASVTAKRYMPPWKPESGYGQFSGERRLSDKEISLIAAWAKAGAPQGSLKDLPPAPVFPTGWSAGHPDLTLSIPAAVAVPADGSDLYRCFVLPYNSDTERFVKTLEFRPGNPRIVHHALLYIDTAGKAKKLDADTPEPGYPCFGGPGFIPGGLLGGWAPGSPANTWPEGVASTIPKGADIVVQIHYHPSGKPETDASTVGLRFSERPTQGLASVIASSRKIDIPAGDARYEVKTSVVIPEDVKAIGITPHAHYLCKEMKVSAHLPDGTTAPLIWIKDWDFNWQGQYRFANPVALPKGSRVDLDYTYDNSAGNTANPSTPPKRVTFGEQTTDEMALVFLTVTLPDPAQVPKFRREMGINILDQALSEDIDPEKLDAPRAAILRMLIHQFDKDGDGKLNAQERGALIEFLRKRSF